MLIAKERPGVYWDYDASGVLWGSDSLKQVGIAALCEKGEQNRVYSIRRISDGKAVFGEDSIMAGMIEKALINGASGVKAVKAGTEESFDYEAALAALEREDDLGAVCCDSTQGAVLQLLKASAAAASDSGRERVAVGCFSGEDPAAFANQLNCERMMLLCQASEGKPAGGGLLAAALAGRLAAAADPSAALNGAVLEGITGLSKAFPEEKLDILLQNGVAVLEMRAGRAELIRGVSTRTKTDGVSDRTFHDINTVLIIDTVIAGIRASLKRMLAGARNNEKRPCDSDSGEAGGVPASGNSGQLPFPSRGRFRRGPVGVRRDGGIYRRQRPEPDRDPGQHYGIRRSLWKMEIFPPAGIFIWRLTAESWRW